MSFLCKLIIFVLLVIFATTARAQISIHPEPPAMPVCIDKKDAYSLAVADMQGTLAKRWEQMVEEGRCRFLPATYLYTIDTYKDDKFTPSRVGEYIAFGERVWGLRAKLPQMVWPMAWDGVKTVNSAWYEAQEINPEAQKRLGISWKSCCNNSDVVKTQFRVERTTYEDEWWYWEKVRSIWLKIPSDIVHWNDPTPDGQPVLFVYQGTPTCFYPGDSGG